MEKVAEELIETYKKWNHIYMHGQYDPNWADGMSLNLLRARIIRCKKQCEETLDTKRLPKEYFQDTPPEVDSEFVACADQIRKNAKAVLKLYEKNEDLQFLEQHIVQLTQKEIKDICIENVIGYRDSLLIYIQRDMLVDMRRHAFHPEIYFESFASCRKKIEYILSNSETDRGLPLGQISIFDVF